MPDHTKPRSPADLFKQPAQKPPSSPVDASKPQTATNARGDTEDATATLYGVYRRGDQYLPVEVTLPTKSVKPLSFNGIQAAFGNYQLAYNKVLGEMTRRFAMRGLQRNNGKR